MITTKQFVNTCTYQFILLTQNINADQIESDSELEIYILLNNN